MALAVVGCHLSKVQAARLYGVSAEIVSRWVEWFNTYGRAGMMDRSSRGSIPFKRVIINQKLLLATVTLS
jgi:transposase-like protein